MQNVSAHKMLIDKMTLKLFLYQDKRVIYWGEMVPFMLVNKQ